LDEGILWERTKRRLVTLSLLALVGGCATQSTQQKTAVATNDQKPKGDLDPSRYGLDPNEFVCTREFTVGSHVPEVACRHSPTEDQSRRQTQDQLRRMYNNQADKSGN
jgi:hypothetical protein